MRYRSLLVGALLALIAGCEAQPAVVGGAASQEERAASHEHAPAAAVEVETPAEERAAGAGGAAHVDSQALARRPQGEEAVCRTFARRVAEASLQHGNDVDAFVAALQDEFIGGSDNPFDMKAGLREGDWNQRYFYAGHGGFRPEYDDAQRYPRGGNHQPGHFVSVLSIATQFGEEQARIAIAYAGDYDEGEEDDLRLSMVAIPLGAGLRDGSVTTAEVAQRVRGLCR
jgi:hypothetical protein